jgi:hypothetical protein
MEAVQASEELLGTLAVGERRQGQTDKQTKLMYTQLYSKTFMAAIPD